MHQIDELLGFVGDSCDKEWHHDDAYRLAWKEKYDAMVDFYVQKVMSYANAYLNSPGGTRYHDDVIKKRRGGKALPILNTKLLQEYEGEEGINWGMAQVLDMFEILKDLAEVTEFETSVFMEILTLLI